MINKDHLSRVVDVEPTNNWRASYQLRAEDSVSRAPVQHSSLRFTLV
jgi:hypothetical protein